MQSNNLIRTSTSTFCRNENNVTGLCNRQSCPLANSQYATVREVDGLCYLFKKTAERAHSPAKMWERIRLADNFEAALAQIDTELEHWPAFLQAKCKLRLAKSLEYLKKMRKIQLDDANAPVLKTRARKVLKREKSREARAKKVAQLENVIERELLERLQKGVYGDIYNLPQNVFESALEKCGGKAAQMDEEAIDEEVEEGEEEFEYVEESEYESELESEREYLAEGEVEMSEDEAGIEDLEDLVRPAAKKRAPYVEIEYETEAAAPKPLTK